jgi:hypothetical protein
MGNCRQLDAIAADEAKTCASARQSRREIVDDRDCSLFEAPVLARACQHIEGKGRAFDERRVLVRLLSAEQDFQPTYPPVQVSHEALQFGMRAAADIKDDDAVKVTRNLDGIGNLRAAATIGGFVVRIGENNAAALLQRLLRNRGEIAHIAARVRPDSRRLVAVSFLLEQKQAHDRAGGRAAQDRQPCAAELARLPRAGKRRPQGRVVASAQLQRVSRTRI